LGGVLMVPVDLNGKATEFLFDPGAAITILLNDGATAANKLIEAK